MKIKLLVILLLFSHPGFAQDSKENADFKLAVNLYNDKMYDLALDQFRSFVNLYPNTAQGIEARFYLGLSQSKLGKHEEARSTFQNFALSYADNIKAPEAWMNVAEEYAVMKNDREAAMAFERVKTYHPSNKLAPAALLKAAELYGKLQDTDNSLRVLRILTQEYTTDEVLPARNKLAEILLSSGQYEQARQESKRVFDSAKDAQLKARASVLYGQSLVAQGKITEAEAVLSDAVKDFKSTSSYYDVLFTLGVLKNKVGKTEDAISSWKSITDDTEHAPKQLRQNACMEMAEANSRRQLQAHALQLFEQAGEIRGLRNREAFYKAGVAAERAGDRVKAAQMYSRALTDSGGTADPRAVLIGAIKGAAFGKKFLESVRLTKEFRQQYPEDVNLPRLLIEGAVIANNELGDSKTSIDFCEWLLEHFPSDELVDDAMMRLAEARKKNGNEYDAIAAYEDLQRRYPSSEFVLEAQKQIRLIRTFELKNKDIGMQKLALLVGDVIAQKSKGNLAYRLAEIYFTDLKDYQLAAEQYAYALTTDLEDALRSAAWLKQAQSYESLAMKEEEKSAKRKEYLTQAVMAYDSLAKLYPAGELGDRASNSAFMLRLQLAEKPEDVKTLGIEFLAKRSGARDRDAALLLLGDSYAAAKNYESAVFVYRLILEKYSDRETASTTQYQLGVAFDGKMEKDSAIQILNQFLAAHPDHAKSAAAAVYLAKAASDSGQTTKAFKYLDLFENRYYYNSIRPRLTLYQADAYFAAQDYKNAYDRYIHSLERLQTDFFSVTGDPEVERSLIFKLGKCSEKRADNSSAKKWYAEYITRDQTTERAGLAYYTLASIAKSEGSIELAAKYLQEVNRITGNTGGQNSSVAFETAETLFQNEQYADAVQRYSQAFAQAKNDTAKKYIQSRIIVSYFRLDNLKEADRRAEEFIKEYSHTYNYEAEFEFERGKCHLRKEDIAKARERFAHIVHSYPKAPIIPETVFWIARMYEMDQKLQLAVRMYDSLLKHFPNDPVIPRVRLSLGNAYYSLEQWDEASKQYRVILENEQRSPDLVPLAMSNLIMTYKEMQMYDAALELTRKYIDRFPNDPDLLDKRIDIGVLYQKLGYYDQSILHLQDLLEAGNADAEAELRYYIAEAYFYKGGYQQAILEFLKVPYLVTKRGKMDWISTSYYMAGQSYEKMSKYDQAITMYKQIISRKDTDAQFKTAAQKEIDRVKTILGKKE
jgi:TolA-binding protein